MSFIEIVKDGFKTLGNAFEVIRTEIDQRNRDHDARRPFRKIKMKAHDLNHVVRIACIVIPDHYKYTHESISCIEEITNIIMGVMNATIENPKQRAYILKIIKKIQAEQMNEYNHIYDMLEATLEELYENGLDRDADTGDKILFLLEYETEDEGLEMIMSKELPKIKSALESVISTQSALKKNGIVIN